MSEIAYRFFTDLFYIIEPYISGKRFKHWDLKDACKHNHIYIVKHLLHTNYHSKIVIQDALNISASNGYYDILRHVFENNDDCICVQTMAHAAREGHLNIVQYLHKRCIFLNSEHILDEAITGDKIEVCKYLHSKGYVMSDYAMDHAAENGNIEMLEWLHKETRAGYSFISVELAAAKGHLRVIQWLFNNTNVIFRPELIDYAAMGGHICIMDWMMQNFNVTYTNQTMMYACLNGHLHFIKWIVQKNDVIRLAWNRDCLMEAVKGGHVDVIQYLHYNTELRCGTREMFKAIQHNRLNIVKWVNDIREDGCVFEAVECAAAWGSLSILRYFVDELDVPITETAHERAQIYNRSKVIEFIHNWIEEGNELLNI